MEKSSNGRPEETLKVGAHDEEKEVQVVLEDSAASKPDVELVRDIFTDGNSKSVNETTDGKNSCSSSSSTVEDAEPEGKSPQVENSENFEEEKLVSDSVVESVELEPGVSSTEEFSQGINPSVEKSGDSDAAGLDAKDTEEKALPSLDETNADSPILQDLSVNGLKEETEQLSSAETTRDSALLTGKPKGIDQETTLPGLDKTNGSKVEADVMSCLTENSGVPAAAVAQGITETKIPASDNDAGGSSGSSDLASKENIKDSLLAANVSIVETRDAGELVNQPETGESSGNQPIVSMSHHPVQPTSWKSCCGLFEVLRRSDR
ncbi:uncharacterized protein LOC111292849 [Durio zibethinus]|uniref:Uncharacterized protein LOC111292849 n=1 Tax=Durio zibethinus TaxID=66656 RepID=A0A6P5YM82_DURZI|nr:uncharacterized protein LOC111292849 [Durio zibethinus]XP_022741184.1 uncharacterized protein LOC111292849 [Durio zibethinus]XP_022741185.1 uncharacterized protein LOC111292849 [Durio zibethinus]XP_022741186.1 uncharacterized protein LOC111292849 [Durio zibethinus]XP_022741187.1 uncharacterized protein LOC111292849 [Durio zibethinus]